MPYWRLSDDPTLWPNPAEAMPDGIVAIGGDLVPERLVQAYARGIFPWYSDGQPILWHCPDPRFVLLPSKLHVSKSLRRSINKGTYRIELDVAFPEIIAACAKQRRPGQRGTWITRDMKSAYVQLFELGLAHSAAAFLGDALVGGLYGVSLGRTFFGESMFANAPDASKTAFVALVEQLQRWDFDLIDCQQETEHLERFGAESWPREKFLAVLSESIDRPTRQGRWRLEPFEGR